jgi:hypothetical protein
MTPELDVVTDPSFLSDLDTREMDELRAVRSRCQSLENSLSYVRRLIQGRVDNVGGELQRRREGGETGDTSDLIGRLPDILSEGSRVAGGPGSVRPPHSLSPDPEVTAQLESMLEDIIAAATLGSVSEIDDDALSGSLTKLNSLEDEVSESRRRLHDVIDTVQAEVTRRYTTGEATVDGLLA